MLEETFRAKVWAPESAGAWRFVTLPKALSQRIRILTGGQRKPFGSLRMKAKIGCTPWETSLFADTRRDTFLLPVRADVRKREKIALGDTIEITISLEF